MAKSKKYSGIHITPTGNGHMVKVHRPMAKEEMGNPMPMDGGGVGNDDMHFGSAEEAANHVQGIMNDHDGDREAPMKAKRGKHPLRGAFGKKNDVDGE